MELSRDVYRDARSGQVLRPPLESTPHHGRQPFLHLLKSGVLFRQTKPSPADDDVCRDGESPIDKQGVADAQQADRNAGQQRPERDAATHGEHVETNGLTSEPRGCGGLQQGVGRSVADAHREASESQ
jgi:hypothetical protein